MNDFCIGRNKFELEENKFTFLLKGLKIAGLYSFLIESLDW